MGAWIEIGRQSKPLPLIRAAPFMGAWIEIDSTDPSATETYMPHPSWVRGLKCDTTKMISNVPSAAPFMGAWIEMFKISLNFWLVLSRTLHGCVD